MTLNVAVATRDPDSPIPISLSAARPKGLALEEKVHVVTQKVLNLLGQLAVRGQAWVAVEHVLCDPPGRDDDPLITRDSSQLEVREARLALPEDLACPTYAQVTLGQLE